MCARKMHADEVETDIALVRRLLAAQFPQWADLVLATVPSAGTDNAIYRLGEDLAVRLPRVVGATGQVAKEQQWLPRLAPHLPLAIPVPLALGTPGEGYPWPWSVCRWLDGENPAIGGIADSRQAGTDLAHFIATLQQIDPTGGPPPGQHNAFRGVPLAMRDAPTRAAITALHGRFESGALTAAWDAALQAPAWHGPPVWLHGDLLTGNVLVTGRRLRAVIDFGCLGVGDPACDVMAAWTLFSGESREAFRAALRVDEATWARGRGWALSVALIQLPYYWDTNPLLVASARRTVDEVLADCQSDA